MKKILLFLAFCLPALCPVSGQESAIFEFRVAGQNQLQRVTIALDSSTAPNTVANFEKLLRHNFYTGLKVHRVIPNSIVQMGDPLSRKNDLTRVGTGGPGYTLAPEIHLPNLVGAVAMSRLPDDINPARRSNGSQFYVCLKPLPDLNAKYTVFGHVTQGMDVLNNISQQPADTNDNPVPPIVIKSAYLASAPPHRLKIWPFNR